MADWPELVKGPAPVLIFAGAAHGQNVELYRRRWPRARYVLFEPNVAYHGQLARFARDPLVTFVPKALSDRRGPATFYQNSDPQTSSLYPPNGADGWGRRIHLGQEMAVDCETLDEFCGEQGIGHIGFIELDAQGGELNALRGARGLLSRKAVDVLMVEVFWTEVYSGVPLAGEVIAFMQEAGYTHGGEVPHQPWPDVKHWGDLIFYGGRKP